ncbi:MAG TPA: GreA/GreB family elongation factor [Gemmatimonadales bacterium]|nr:GreA/GreB family elongation factor [Gemmatimonadales bacterium]
MLDDIRRKLSDEVQRLNHELAVTLPETLKRALQMGDLRENGDYHAALERQGFIQARLTHLRSRLAKLSQIDVTKIPVDRVGLGSRVVVLDTATKERATYELVVSDAIDFDGDGGANQISVASPLGRGLLEHKVGDVAVILLPNGPRKLKVVELTTFHQQLADAKEETQQ